MADCLVNGEGCRVPYNSDKIEYFRSNASFILIVEKDAVFRKIISDLDWNSSNEFPSLILATSKGMPDRPTRSFLRLLLDTLKIPIFGIFDCDAYGINIALNYKFGAVKESNFEDFRLSIHEMKWIERAILKGIKTRSMLKGTRWLEEVETMIKNGNKVEIESVYNIRDDHYLLDHYLRYKLDNSLWI
ncbi:MAG: DNA topoisomerase 6 subunit A [Paramarteilia canceri]